MRVGRWIVTAAVLMVASGGLSACSSQDSGYASNSGTTPPGAPIVIGTIGSYTGPQAAVLGKSAVGVEAWVREINDAGGLDGHPVKLIVKDDASDPAKSLQAAKELVEKDKVVAIVGETSLVDASWQQYVEQKKVPVVGGLVPEQTFLVSPMFFPSGSSSVVTTFGLLDQAKTAGATEVGAIYCAESPVCAQVDGLGRAFGAIVGVPWTSGKASATEPSYTAQCLTMKNAGVDALFLAHNSAVVVRVASDCGAAGYKPREIGQLSAIDSTILADPAFEGALFVGGNATFTDDSIPGIKEYRTAIEKFAPGITADDQFNITELYSWAGAKLFEKAAAAAKLTPTSTPADVLEGLYGLKNETLDGLAGPLNFVPGKPALPACYFVSTIKAGALVATESAPVCLTAAQLGAVGQVLQKMQG